MSAFDTLCIRIGQFHFNITGTKSISPLNISLPIQKNVAHLIAH